MGRLMYKVVVDCCLFVLATFQAVTGVILYIAPRGRGSGSWTFLGVDKHTWGDWHTYAGFIIIGLVVIHLILNWRVFVCQLKSVLGRKSA